MIAFLKRLFLKPSIEDLLEEFGGEETPYASAPKRHPGDAKVEEGEQLVFSARPTGRTFSSYRKSAHRKLQGKEADELRLLIALRGADYIWKSRGACLLTHTQIGQFHYFTADRQGGFIKIVEKNGRFHYLEGFTYSMISFMLWGESDALQLRPTNEALQPEPVSIAQAACQPPSRGG
jgi:hypothetical protein